MSKFLITGGAGFIGGNYCHCIVNKYPNDQFVCLDALTYAGNMETLEDVLKKPNFKFVKGNICDKNFVFNLFEKEKFDYVINFAAESHVDRSIENPGIFLQSNIIGVQILMDACRKYGINRYHQVSTDEVYGDLPLDKPDMLFTEDLPLKASSPYSASKASADLLVMAYHRTFGLPVTISRCSNNYGPYQFPEKLIPLMIQKAQKNENLPVYGNGLNVRDWLYVTDHCYAIDLIVRHGRDGEVYNVGGHNERSNIQIVKTILKELDKSENLISFVKDRPGHDLRYAMDPSKIEKELGWRPEFNFEAGIAETIRWNLNNQTWLKHVESGEYMKWMEKHYDN
jgi:dTDP-glucose 4,6-dehydratase